LFAAFTDAARPIWLANSGQVLPGAQNGCSGVLANIAAADLHFLQRFVALMTLSDL